jgi:hypothetical protein
MTRARSPVVDARTFAPNRTPQPSGCRACGAPVAPLVVKAYCCKAHKKRASKLRRDGVVLAAIPGVCPVCAAPFEPSSSLAAFCSRRCAQSWHHATHPWLAFTSMVERPRPLRWLAAQLGLEPDDPRLPDAALKLAAAGRLCVYVRRDGTVGEVGLPTKRNRERRRA